ncbi:MAG: hypothetical protein NT027_00935 [Proteobacteria bacterium]|nr:hypothetical protein [Pseudomonadota bacterium]
MFKLILCTLLVVLTGCKSSGKNDSALLSDKAAVKPNGEFLVGKKFVFDAKAIIGIDLGNESVTFLDDKEMIWNRPLGFESNLETRGTYVVEGDKVICKFKEDPYGWQLREFKLGADKRALKLSRKQKQENGEWSDFVKTGSEDMDFPFFKIEESKNVTLIGKKFLYDSFPGSSLSSIESVSFLDDKKMVWSRPLDFSGSLTTEGTYKVEGDIVTCNYTEDPYGPQLRILRIKNDKQLVLIKQQKKENGKWVDYPKIGKPEFDSPTFVLQKP